jgi:WD40 repeat protein
VATGQLLHTLSGHTALIFGVAFSPDGSRVATASSDQTVKVWSVETGEELLTLRAPSSDGFASVAFSPDGKVLLAASRDGLVRGYLMDTNDLVALARSRVTRQLTDAECHKYLHVDVCPASAMATP